MRLVKRQFQRDTRPDCGQFFQFYHLENVFCIVFHPSWKTIWNRLLNVATRCEVDRSVHQCKASCDIVRYIPESLKPIQYVVDRTRALSSWAFEITARCPPLSPHRPSAAGHVALAVYNWNILKLDEGETALVAGCRGVRDRHQFRMRRLICCFN